MDLPTLSEIEAAAEVVYRAMPPTPQYCWPLLAARCGAEVWVKHENHTPIGAFKVRGGLNFMNDMAGQGGGKTKAITATRGNHGQSVAFAARQFGVPVVIVVPEGNSVEKNAAMRALGAELVEHGHDFQAAYEYALARAADDGLRLIDSFHPLLVRGVATYGLELLRAVADLDTVYVPIGLGSGICGVMAARDALGLTTKVVGVVSENAAAYALSFAKGEPVSTNSADTFADGVACRVPVAAAVALINRGAERVVTVSEEEIKAAMRHYFQDTHNVVEGAGAVPLAALLQEKGKMAGKTVGVVASGGNIDTDLYRGILQGA